MARLVPDWGRLDAPFVLIGEMPDKHANFQNKAFVGPSGLRLEEWWRSIGLTRQDFYLTYVCPLWMPKGILSVPQTDLEHWTQELYKRLSYLSNIRIVIPIEETKYSRSAALYALTGKTSITKWRGSLLSFTPRQGQSIKVIPTIHPLSTFSAPYLEKRCRFDWQRIADESKDPSLRLPQRDHFIRPTLDDVKAFSATVRQNGSPLAIDIETPREQKLITTKGKNGKDRVKKVYGAARITCIGFSHDPAFSITIPTTHDYWGNWDDVETCWQLIRELCHLPNEKVLQNGLFDSFYLADHHLWLPDCNWRWDTLAMHHAIDANDDHDLAYMASVWTREPYWKDEAKDPDEIQKYTSNLDAFWTYCGKDAAVTRELYDRFHSVLHADGRLDFYDRHYRQLFDPLLTIMRHGVRRDQAAAAARFKRLASDMLTIQGQLADLAGEPLVAKKSFSPTKLKKFLYETLRLPKKMKLRKGKEEPTVTIDEIALRQLRLKYPDRAGTAIDLLLEHRRKEALQKFVKESNEDADGRVRCSYRFTTETGRLSSSKNPRGTGMNLQNVDREVREVYVPD